MGWVVNLVGHTVGPVTFLVTSDSRLALLACSFSSWEMELLNLATSCFMGRGFVEMQNGGTVVPQEVHFRGGGQNLGLGVGMELNPLGSGELKPLGRI